MHYKFFIIKYGEDKFLKVKPDYPEECTWLNQQLKTEHGKNPLSQLMNQGWSIKQFSIYTEPKTNAPVFILLLEKP